MALLIAYLALLLTTTLYLATRAYLIPRPIPGIPYSRISHLMPWGALLSLGLYNFRTGEVFAWFSLQCAQHRAPLVQVFLPSFSRARPTLVLAHLAEIEHVVTRRVREVDRAANMRRWFGVLVPRATVGMPTHGGVFRAQRRLWNVVLAPAFLERVAAERLHEAALVLVRVWEGKAAAARDAAFDAREDVRMATLDGIWGMCLGSRLGLLDAKVGSGAMRVGKRRADGSVVFGETRMPPFYATFGTLLMCMDWVMQGISAPMYTWFFTVTGILGRAAKKKDEILDVCIRASRDRIARNDGEVTCALDAVLLKDRRLQKQTPTPDGPSHITSDAVLRDELLELLITGHETTASTILWALKYLTDSPDTQHALRAALRTAFPHSANSSIPSAREIVKAEIPYLDAVIAESLRLSATGPVSFRETLVECEILGHVVPPGTPIILSTQGPSYTDPRMPIVEPSRHAQRTTRKPPSPSTPRTPDASPQTQPQPQPLTAFAPTRWLTAHPSAPARAFNAHAVPMLPFSAGPRGCFGKSIALLELRIVLAVLVCAFEFPRLGPGLSGYRAADGLTRRPRVCFVAPRRGG